VRLEVRDREQAVRRARIAAAGAAVAGGAAAFGVLALGGGGHAPASAAASPPGDRATVERRNLVDRESVQGTLGYADTGTLAAGTAGTITALRDAGAVVTRGHSLYDIDGKPAAWLLYGALPAWRDFAPGMSDGADVRQLERNLRALGDDPDGDMDVDDHWDWATTAAVERFQDARDETEDGTLSRGEVVFRGGATRIGSPSAAVGDQAAPGTPLSGISSTERRVSVDLDAERQEVAREGEVVTVDLPTGIAARGRITDVGKVATKPKGDADATIEITIALRGKAARGNGLDQAPVDVGFAVEQRKHVLAVPVKALLARQGGGYAVEVVERGAHRIVPVEPGLYTDDYVEVSGSDLRAGMTVVTAR
jgi:peptidoglycan hydrolase-like protein with peptidoglycan-binding domain